MSYFCNLTSYVVVHRAAVNRIINLTESTIASGDDEGCIKVSLLVLYIFYSLLNDYDYCLHLHSETRVIESVKD